MVSVGCHMLSCHLVMVPVIIIDSVVIVISVEYIEYIEYMNTYGSVSPGRGKCLFNVLFFLKVEGWCG